LGRKPWAQPLYRCAVQTEVKFSIKEKEGKDVL